ncbi:MAG: NAD(P)/FAD-dependent oxidoreductase [Anaerolineales bacterium]|nr:NAD(P)/FAD-dependent oxidoreductase [Anaerolineales bacterium]
MSASSPVFDVAVIGAGAVGSAIARELSRYALSVALVEAGTDVGVGTSKANTAIWHTGYDAKPGTLESRLLKRSYARMAEFLPAAGVPVELTGGLLIAWTPEQQAALPKLHAQGLANGDDDIYLMGPDEVYRREPHLGPGALGGLFVPGEGILCTYTLPLALATQAVLNGTALRLNFAVTQIAPGPDGTHTLSSATGGALTCRYLVNAAGLQGDTIDRLLGHNDFTITPRRGQLIVFDKFARRLVNHILLPVPTATTKGVLISPTVYGNVLLGPTAEDLPDKTATNTTAAGLEALWEKGRVIIPDLLHEEVTATYAGLRPATEHSDYQIRLHAAQRYVTVGGIRSTGISGAMGIAEYVVGLLGEAGLGLGLKPDFAPVHMPNIGEAGVRPYQSAELIAANPDYGRMVCHCERVSLGELRAALAAPIPAQTIDGMRRRTRALQGRCQGFNCHAAVVGLLAQHTGQSAAALTGLEDARAH